jgi:DNA-binding protein HU-beta
MSSPGIVADAAVVEGPVVSNRPQTLLASEKSGNIHAESATKEDEVTKSELVDQVADRAGLTKGEAARAVEAVLGTVQDTLRRGSEITLSGFGKFHVGERGARQGVNPRTGERIQIAAARVPRFTAGTGLKAAVKGR